MIILFLKLLLIHSVASVSNYAGWNPHAGLPQVGSIYDYFNIPIQGTDN